MRGEGEVADARSVGQDHRDRRGLPALAAPGFQDVADGAGAQGVARQGEFDGEGELLRAVVVEQREEPEEMRPEHVTARGQARELKCTGFIGERLV